MKINDTTTSYTQVEEEEEQHLKDAAEAVETMARSTGWQKYIKPYLEAQASSERLMGATEKNFSKIKGEIQAYQDVLSEVDRFINTGKQTD